jgi:hypothetical protein
VGPWYVTGLVSGAGGIGGIGALDGLTLGIVEVELEATGSMVWSIA